MDSLPHDLLASILAKMPLKSIASSKLVSKQWKSILESKIFYQLFQSHHQNSHSLWSLLCRVSRKEVIAHYGCKHWGLTESLGSNISYFITSLFLVEKIMVVAYSDVGLMLIRLVDRGPWYDTYYVANPISREYVKIPSIVPGTDWKTKFSAHTMNTSGLVTQVENDVVLSYKIVLMKYIRTKTFEDDICLLIYSSETGLWSSSTLRSPRLSWLDHPISLKGNIYWIGFNYTLREHVLVYHNFYANGTKSDRCEVIPFPDVEKINVFKRVCAISQGSLIYMKIKTLPEDDDDGRFEHKVSVWMLKSGEWQIVSEISHDFTNPRIYDLEFTINPFDAKTVYFWSKKQKHLASINLDRCKLGLHNNNNFECSRVGCIQRISEEWYLWEGLSESLLQIVFLPRWLYRIPCSPS